MARRTTKNWKSCACGLSYTRAAWERLPFAGSIITETPKLLLKLELRHCHCRSTVAIERRERKARQRSGS